MSPRQSVLETLFIEIPLSLIKGLKSSALGFGEVASIMFSVLTKFAESLLADSHIPNTKRNSKWLMFHFG